ncbi:ankyrin repeat domain-containing protein [Flexithrix dorotheae]|uniref:ankyrin repeat domain-containing protein n=1 Tax=Flexithrix dorotheae TaxID=70993 RepID=UPI00037DCEDD|nr:ankyrin repeat domain-containing protein [Flexithrix dorotheae]
MEPKKLRFQKKLTFFFLFSLLSGLSLNAIGQESEVNVIFKAIEKNQVDQIRTLLETGTDPNIKDALRNTPLHMAAFYGYEDVIDLLASKGGDVNAINEAGRSPLYEAVRADHQQAVSALIANGAKLTPKYTDKRFTILHFAAMENRYEISEILLENGANLKVKDALGKKPADYAKATKNKMLVKLYKDKRWK